MIDFHGCFKLKESGSLMLLVAAVDCMWWVSSSWNPEKRYFSGTTKKEEKSYRKSCIPGPHRTCETVPSHARSVSVARIPQQVQHAKILWPSRVRRAGIATRLAAGIDETKTGSHETDA